MKKKRDLSAMPIPYRRGNKWGFCDTEMNILIPIVYDEVRPFKENLAAVKLGDYWGFIGIKGNLVIETRYITVADFLEGESIVQCKESNCKLLIDEKGIVIGEYNNYSVKTDEYTIDRTSIKSGDDYEIKYIYCDNYGNKILPPPPFNYYNSAGKFINGIALVNGDMFIDKKGKPVFDVKLLAADTFSEGYSAVRFADKSVGYISEKGEKIVCQDFDETRSFQSGLAAVKMRGKWKFIDKTFEVAFKEGVKYQNWQGDKIIDGFDETKGFSEGFAGVRLVERWGFINTRGEIVIGFKYENPNYGRMQDSYYLFKDGVAKVLSKEKNYFQNDKEDDENSNRVFSGYIDSAGKEYFESIFRILTSKNYFYQNDDADKNASRIVYKIMEFLEVGDWNELGNRIEKIVFSYELYYNFNEFETKFLIRTKRQIDELGKQILQLKRISDNLTSAKKLLEINLLHNIYRLSLLRGYQNIYKVLESTIGNWREIDSYIKSTIIKLGNETRQPKYLFSNFRLKNQCYKEYQNKYVTESLKQKIIDYVGKNKFDEIYFLLSPSLDFCFEEESDQSPQRIHNVKKKLLNLKSSIVQLKSLSYSIINSESYKKCLKFINNSKFLSEEWLHLKKKIKESSIDSSSLKTNTVVDLMTSKPYFFLQLISTYYPFDEEELSEFENYLDWELLSQNKHIYFSSSLVHRFRNKWFWSFLTNNISIYWTTEMIEEFRGYLSRPNHILGNPMTSLCGSANVGWNVSSMEKFKDIIDWTSLSRNNSLPWSAELIKKFRHNWDWEMLCVHGEFWTTELIITLQNELDHNLERWAYLLSNTHIEWTIEFILLFKEKWFSTNPFRRHGENDCYKNPKIPWDENLLETFESSLNWYRLSESKYLPWSKELITKYFSKWDWKSLVLNPSINWDESLITEFEKKILSDYECRRWIVTNPSLKWNENLIDRFIDLIDWDYLCQSEKMKWTLKLLEKYSNKINWGELFENQSILWNDEMLNSPVVKNKFVNEFESDYSSLFDHLVKLKELESSIRIENAKTDFDYDNFLKEKFPDNESEIPNHDIWIKNFQPFLNKISISEILNTIIGSCEVPEFSSEEIKADILAEMKHEEEEEWYRQNHMSKHELADFLGYGDDDIDDISEDDLWDMTGH